MMKLWCVRALVLCCLSVTACADTVGGAPATIGTTANPGIGDGVASGAAARSASAALTTGAPGPGETPGDFPGVMCRIDEDTTIGVPVEAVVDSQWREPDTEDRSRMAPTSFADAHALLDPDSAAARADDPRRADAIAAMLEARERGDRQAIIAIVAEAAALEPMGTP